MSFQDDILAQEAAATAGLNPGDEQRTYTPSGATAGVSVWLNVNRVGPRAVPGVPDVFAAPEFKVFLYAGQGIDSIDTGGDTVTIPLKFGGAAVAVPVAEIVSQDAAGWTLRLE